MLKFPALFCDSRSLYNDHPGFDVFDVNRNAFSCASRLPRVAHPPCRLFSRMRSFSSAPVSELKCAYHALSGIRQFGGILEHPRSSTLWQNGNFDLSGGIDQYGGYLRSVNLSWFGYPAQKKTMLYFVGITPGQLPPFPISFDAITHVVSGSSRSLLPELSKSLRSSTPMLMIEYIYQTLNIIHHGSL